MTRTELDKQRCGCGVPGCESPLILNQACHPRSGVEVEYFNGILTITCATCSKPVVAIQVAP